MSLPAKLVGSTELNISDVLTGLIHGASLSAYVPPQPEAVVK